jgi:hypothetical protein
LIIFWIPAPLVPAWRRDLDARLGLEAGDGVDNDVAHGFEEAETEASKVDELSQVRHVVEGQPPKSLNVR